MSEEYLMQAYLAGLRLDTQMPIIMFSPQTTLQCLVLRKIYEKAHPLKAQSTNWNNQKPQLNTNQQRGVLNVRRQESH